MLPFASHQNILDLPFESGAATTAALQTSTRISKGLLELLWMGAALPSRNGLVDRKDMWLFGMINLVKDGTQLSTPQRRNLSLTL